MIMNDRFVQNYYTIVQINCINKNNELRKLLKAVGGFCMLGFPQFKFLWVLQFYKNTVKQQLEGVTDSVIGDLMIKENQA